MRNITILVLLIVGAFQLYSQEINYLSELISGEYEIHGYKESHEIVLNPDSSYIEYYSKTIGYRPIKFEYKGWYELDSTHVILHPDTFTYSRVYFDSIDSNTIVADQGKEKYIDTLAVLIFHEKIFLLNIDCPENDTGCISDFELFLVRVTEGSEMNYRNFPFLTKECEGCKSSSLDNSVL